MRSAILRTCRSEDVFVRISENIKVGSVYPLRLSLGKQMAISVKGMVMRAVADDCSLPGYGIMFKESDRDRERRA